MTKLQWVQTQKPFRQEYLLGRDTDGSTSTIRLHKAQHGASSLEPDVFWSTNVTLLSFNFSCQYLVVNFNNLSCSVETSFSSAMAGKKKQHLKKIVVLILCRGNGVDPAGYGVGVGVGVKKNFGVRGRGRGWSFKKNTGARGH